MMSFFFRGLLIVVGFLQLLEFRHQKIDHLIGFLRVPGVFKGRGCSWGTLRIPFGKIGEA